MSEATKAEIKEWQQCYRTPRAFFDWVERVVLPVYGHSKFTLDACATPWNAMCREFIGPPGTAPVEGMIGVDALVTPWETSGAVWCNAGFSKPLPWVKRCIEARDAGRVVCHLTHNTHTPDWAQLYAIPQARACWMITPRINFDEDPRLADMMRARGQESPGNARDSFLWVYTPEEWPGGCAFIVADPWCEKVSRRKRVS